jgi:secreted trypsin-like serine protease
MRFVGTLSVVGLSLLLSVMNATAQQPSPLPRPVDRVKGLQQPPPDTTQNINGGTSAEAGKFPFQVALIRSDTPQGREHFGQFCGGALIDRIWIVTAAHCVPSTTEQEVDVYIGSVTLPSGGARGGGTRLSLAKIVSHQNYVEATHDNDVAMLKLAQPAPANLTPAVVATPAIADVAGTTGAKVTVIGWGAMTEGGSTTPTLMEVTVTVQDRQQCEANYRSVVPTTRITANMFCAGELEGVKDSCQGDSGGFIGAPRAGGGFDQLGVVSWGFGCARPGLFGVYTRLANYEPWIRTIMKTF